MRVPVLRELNPVDVWEHTPLDYYKRGEYPRFLRPPGPRLGDFDTRPARPAQAAPYALG